MQVKFRLKILRDSWNISRCHEGYSSNQRCQKRKNNYKT